MKRLAAAACIVLGFWVGLFGLLFLVGFGGHLYRLVIAAVCLLGGAALAGVGVRWWKHADARTPERLRKDILSLAASRGGSITEAEVAAAMPERMEPALQVLAEMVLAGLCTRRAAVDVIRYEFAQLLPTVLIRRCGYCGWEAPLSSQVTACARCGGAIVSERGVEGEGIGLEHRPVCNPQEKR